MFEIVYKLSIIVFHICIFVQAADYNYQDTQQWVKINPSCGGDKQSPIDIDRQKLTVVTSKSRDLEFRNYDMVPSKIILKNIGHTVQVEGLWNRRKVPSISGGPLEGEYVFHQLHFHWGPTNDVGSEHTFNGKHYPLESHLIHYKKNYKAFSNALKHKDGLAVISNMYEDTCCGKTEMSLIQDGLLKVRQVGSDTEVTPFSLSNFGIDKNMPYITYSGSLTTPPCSEVVTWIVSGVKRNITQKQDMKIHIKGLYSTYCGLLTASCRKAVTWIISYECQDDACEGVSIMEKSNIA